MGGLDPGILEPLLGCRTIFKKGVEGVRTRVLREAAGGFRQPLCLALDRPLGEDSVSRHCPIGVDTSGALAHIFLGTLLLSFLSLAFLPLPR